MFGAGVSAEQYGKQIADLENEGTDANGQLASDLSPLPPSSFNGPITAYRAYAEHWAAKLATQLPVLRADLAGGARAASEQAWSVAYDDYLHLGAVYGLLPGTLDRQIDGLPQTVAPGQSFSGLHRIEMGLWTGASPRLLVPWAARLGHDVVTLRKVLPMVQITPLAYATRAHEILEDAQRDLLSGTEVPWSGAGVLGTAAGLAATQEVVSTLVPLLQGRDNTLVEVQNWLGELQGAFNRVRTQHGGIWPTLSELTLPQRESLDGTLAGALGALSDVPGTLETQDVPVIPSIARSK